MSIPTPYDHLVDLYTEAYEARISGHYNFIELINKAENFKSAIDKQELEHKGRI
jgi:hypothetical protein